MEETLSVGWITGTVRRWFAVTSGALTLVTLSLFAATNTRLWAWVAIGLTGKSGNRVGLECPRCP